MFGGLAKDQMRIVWNQEYTAVEQHILLMKYHRNATLLSILSNSSRRLVHVDPSMSLQTATLQ